MGLFEKAKQWGFGRAVAGHAKEARVGKLGSGMKTVWQLLDGWKTWLVAIVALYRLACESCATSGYLDAAINALGWNTVTGAFDAREALAAGAVLVALGHRLWKAIKQYRAGRPATQLLSEAPAK